MANQRISQGQADILIEACRLKVIFKEIGDYWDPRPLGNAQIDRLEKRGMLAKSENSRSYRITDLGRAALDQHMINDANGRYSDVQLEEIAYRAALSNSERTDE